MDITLSCIVNGLGGFLELKYIDTKGVWDEKVNVDFDGSRKECWAFVGRRY